MLHFLRTLILPISIAIGIVGYLIYANIQALDFTHHVVKTAVDIINPSLLFCMLLLSFCKVDFLAIRMQRWMSYMLLVQLVGSVLFFIPLVFSPTSVFRYFLEGGMLMFICPTATAAVVVSYKLGGKIEFVIGYTIASNVLASILFPLFISLLYCQTFDVMWVSFCKILVHVFPILILPMLTAVFLKMYFPRYHAFLARNTNVAFYIWAISLICCMGISTHAFMKSDVDAQILVSLAVVAFLSCALQFFLGHFIGGKNGNDVSGSQSLGQKNTAFAIWLAYTFMTPLSALASSVYILYQNCYNSWQLYQHEKIRSN